MYHPLWLIILAGVIAGTAVLGNFAVIFVIATRKGLRRTCVNWLVLSLAVSDVCVGVISYPVHTLCKNLLVPCEEIPSVYIGRWTSLFASILALCVMITDRYMAVVWPMKYSTKKRKKRTKLSILLTWALSGVLSLIGLWARRSKGVAEKIYHVFVIGSIFILPSVVLTALTVHMLLTSRKHARQIRLINRQLNFNHSGVAAKDPPKPRRAMEFITSRLTTALVSIFTATYLSYAFCAICNVKGSQLPVSFYYYKQLLPLVNSALNPIAYALIKSDIRKELTTMALKCVRKAKLCPPDALPRRVHENNCVINGFGYTGEFSHDCRRIQQSVLWSAFYIGLW